MITAIHIIVGAAVGAVVAWVYFKMLRSQVKSIAEGRRSPAMMGLGFLGRMAVLGLAMAGLLAWAYAAGVAFALAFLVTRMATLRRLRGDAANALEQAEGQDEP